MADDLTGALTAVVAVVTLPLGVLAFLFAGWKLSVVVFVVGWFLFTPLIPIVGEEFAPAVGDAFGDSESSAEEAGPLEELKRRYARGEIGDEEFERQVGNLVETEDVRIDTDADLDRLAESTADAEERDVDRLRE